MRLKPKDGVEALELPGGEFVARDPDTGQAVVLNELGVIVWELCDGAHGHEEIASLIHERFPEVAREKVGGDVRALLDRLVAAGLMEQAEEG